MATTLTARIALLKQALGDENWHTALNTTLDLLDKYLGRLIPEAEATHDPNVEGIAASYVGQRIFDVECVAWWVATVIGPTVWVREVPFGLVADYVGPIASVPDGWVLCDGTVYARGAAHGGNLSTPNLGGVVMVGHDAASADFNVLPSALAAPKTGGASEFVVTYDNILQFIATTGAPVGDTIKRRVGQSIVFGPPGGTADIPGANNTHTHAVPIGSPAPVPISLLQPYYVAGKVLKL